MWGLGMVAVQCAVQAGQSIGSNSFNHFLFAVKKKEKGEGFGPALLLDYDPPRLGPFLDASNYPIGLDACFC